MGFFAEHKNIEIKSNKLLLREIKKTDLSKCIKWLHDPEITKFLSNDIKNVTEEEETRWFESVKRSNNDIVFSIIIRDSQEYIGNCSLNKIDWIHKTCRMGIFIGDKEFWNKGFGTLAIKVLIDFALNKIGMNKIELIVYEYNHRAMKVYKNCGFATVSTIKHHHLYNHRYWDAYLMEYIK